MTILKSMSQSFSFFSFKLTRSRPLSAPSSPTGPPHCLGFWPAVGRLASACPKPATRRRPLPLQPPSERPWRAPRRGPGRAVAGRDCRQPAGVGPLKQGERLTARAWLRRVWQPRRWQVGWLLPGSWGSWSCRQAVETGGGHLR